MVRGQCPRGYQNSLHINLAIHNDSYKLGFVLQSQNKVLQMTRELAKPTPVSGRC